MSFLLSETCESDWWLTSLVVLFWELDGELVENLFGVTLQSSIQGSWTIDNDKTEWWFSNEKLLLQIFKVELWLAAVNWQIDGLERFKVADKFLFGSWVFVHYSTAEEDQTIIRGSLIQFESFSRGDLGFSDWLSVSSVLNVDGFSLLLDQHSCDLWDVFSGWDDDGDDTAADLGSFEPLEESLHSEDFDWLVLFFEFVHLEKLL